MYANTKLSELLERDIQPWKSNQSQESEFQLPIIATSSTNTPILKRNLRSTVIVKVKLLGTKIQVT
jgi:hypothetical protein